MGVINLRYIYITIGNWFLTSSFAGPSGLNAYACYKCLRVYKRKGTLKRHLRVECGKEKSFQCPFCGQSYYYKQELKIHCFAKHNSNL